MRIERVVVGAVQTNCYIIFNEDGPHKGEAVVCDPGDYASRIAEKLSSLNVTCSTILITHGHFDHISAVTAVKEKYGAKVFAGRDEAELLGNSELNVSARIHRPVEISADRYLNDGEVFEAAGIKFKTVFTPGHTRGGVCFYIPEGNILLSGDTLFYQSYGRTDLPTGDEAALFSSITNKLMQLPGETKVLPGHGEATTIERERRFFGA